MRTFRLMIAGGGTGGHITPGVAVVEAVRQRVPILKTLWVGVKGRREEDMVPRFKIPLITMNLRGLERSLRPSAILRNLKNGLNWITMRPVFQAAAIIREFEPDFVLGTGGYVCAPIMIAARMMKIRTWILEQNSAPGLTVRKLARWVDGVGIAYETTRDCLPASAPVELVGNPVLSTIMTASRESGIADFKLNPMLKTLLVMGGSLGSVALNDALRDLLRIDAAGTILKDWQILHAVGQRKFENYMKDIPENDNYHPHPFIYNAPEALAASDLVICRAGAMTLAEITARGVPSIIVPWQGAVRDHQTTNARALDQAGAAILVPETGLSGMRLADIIRSLNAHPERLDTMARKARQLGRPDAAQRIADFIMAGGDPQT
ncbi:undecaprenyldiphospho-muramoylpentapeptide beta-N-acetylglucosaminyltransferase [bacterium]|nr:undecaprenyldiphospho-muramoylpentapeptide beta-N-acetylglucosaminyltransferase [bacterium]